MDFEIRKVRKAHGPMKLRREREEYFRLVREGYSNKEASGLVGINERTGREWRNGRTDPNRFRAPAQSERAPGPASSGRYLRGDERIHIADRLREKTTVRSIAVEPLAAWTAHENHWRPSSLPDSPGWDPADQQRIGTLRTRELELAALIVGHPFWEEIAAEERADARTKLKHRRQSTEKATA